MNHLRSLLNCLLSKRDQNCPLLNDCCFDTHSFELSWTPQRAWSVLGCLLPPVCFRQHVQQALVAPSTSLVRNWSVNFQLPLAPRCSIDLRKQYWLRKQVQSDKPCFGDMSRGYQPSLLAQMILQHHLVRPIDFVKDRFDCNPFAVHSCNSGLNWKLSSCAKSTTVAHFVRHLQFGIVLVSWAEQAETRKAWVSTLLMDYPPSSSWESIARVSAFLGLFVNASRTRHSHLCHQCNL